MFALKTDKSSELSEKKPLNIQVLKNKILIAYKKLKTITKHEFRDENKFKLAALSPEQLVRLKSLESDLHLYLIAYEADPKILNKKIDILNRVNGLLNDYCKLSQENSKKYANEDFSKFFE